MGHSPIILRIIPTTDPKHGGPIASALETSRALLRLGVQTEFVAFDPSDAPWHAGIEFPIHAMGKGWSHWSVSPDFDRWLKANAGRYDAIVLHGIYRYFLWRSWRILSNLGIPYVIYTHGALDPWYKRRYPLKHLKKWLFWPWGIYPALRDAQVVLFTSDEERILARQSFWLYSCREQVVPYGVRLPPPNSDKLIDAFIDRVPNAQGKRVILFLGRLHPKKGIDLLLRGFRVAAERWPDLHLVIAGPDRSGLTENLMGLACDLGISQAVSFSGMLEGSAKWGAFYNADVFALCSHTENFGVSVVEALGCGCPVLISNKVNIWREIENDGAGLIATDSAEGAEALLTSWGELDEKSKSRMRVAALSCFKRHFEIGECAERLLSILIPSGENCGDSLEDT